MTGGKNISIKQLNEQMSENEIADRKFHFDLSEHAQL